MEIIIYLAVLVVASLPLACGYVMEGGDILIWIARIEEVKECLQIGQLQWFPSAELTIANEGQFSALNSNLWLMLPAVIRLEGGSVTASYRVYMLFLNVVSLLAAKKMFDELFENKIAVSCGVLLYMTCPYRIYICYDKADLGMMAAWALIPLVIWGMIKIFHSSANWKCMVITSVAFAAVGYANGILLLLLTGVIVLGIIKYKKISGVIPLLFGGVLFSPGAIYWLKYLLTGGMEQWGLPVKSIASEGYAVGQFFSSWVYSENRPGLGLGLLIGLFVLLWLGVTENHLGIMKKYGFFVVILCLLTAMSSIYFPWDIVQRLGAPFLRLVSMMETPGICFGFVSLTLCVLCTYGVECAIKQQKLFVKIGLPLIIAFASMGVAVYLCNTLTYHRLPMFL